MFGLTSEELACFVDLQSESVEIDQVCFDFFNWEINQHTGNFRGIVFSGKGFNEFEDEFSDLGLIVGVSLHDGGGEHDSFLGIDLIGGL